MAVESESLIISSSKSPVGRRDLAVMNEDTFNHKCTREPLQGSSETSKGNQLKEATEYLVSTAPSL